jgi:hypothetical protein
LSGIVDKTLQKHLTINLTQFLRENELKKYIQINMLFKKKNVVVY